MTLARDLARGLSPVEMHAEGLVAAFGELASSITKRFRIQCVFDQETPVLMDDPAVATHLYRIAQEAISNAVRHGKAKRLDLSLSERGGILTLTVEDDGEGLPEHWEAHKGLGTGIMAHRAAMIGGTLTLEPALTGGTILTCSLPRNPPPPPPPHDTP